MPVNADADPCSDPPPFPHKAGVSEKVGLNAQAVVAAHIAGRIDLSQGKADGEEFKRRGHFLHRFGLSIGRDQSLGGVHRQQVRRIQRCQNRTVA